MSKPAVTGSCADVGGVVDSSINVMRNGAKAHVYRLLCADLEVRVRGGVMQRMEWKRWSWKRWKHAARSESSSESSSERSSARSSVSIGNESKSNGRIVSELSAGLLLLLLLLKLKLKLLLLLLLLLWRARNGAGGRRCEWVLC